MSELLKDLLFLIGTHPARDEFLEMFEASIPPYKEGMTLEEYGAKCAVESGRLKAYEGLKGLISS